MAMELELKMARELEPEMTTELERVVRQRDGLDQETWDDLLVVAQEEMEMPGADPEEVLREVFGLEPDYVFDLIELVG